MNDTLAGASPVDQPVGALPEPLPCPFCGHVGLTFSEGSTFRWLAYSCSYCGMGCETRVQTLGKGQPADRRAQAERDAVSQWNTRATLEQSEAQPATEADEAVYQAIADNYAQPRVSASRLHFAVAQQLQSYVDDPAFPDGEGEKTTLGNAIELLTCATQPSVSAEPVVGETWHVLRAGATACTTLKVLEVTDKTVLFEHKYGSPERIPLEMVQFVELKSKPEPSAPYVPLTEDEIYDIWNQEIVGLDHLPMIDLFVSAVRAVERAHGINSEGE